MKDKINPDHYKLANGIEANDVTQHFGFNEGNVIKYVWRAGKKEGEKRLTDLKKAVWYLNQLVETEELKNALPPGPSMPCPNSFDGHSFISDYYLPADLAAWKDAT